MNKSCKSWNYSIYHSHINGFDVTSTLKITTLKTWIGRVLLYEIEHKSVKGPFDQHLETTMTAGDIKSRQKLLSFKTPTHSMLKNKLVGRFSIVEED